MNHNSVNIQLIVQGINNAAPSTSSTRRAAPSTAWAALYFAAGNKIQPLPSPQYRARPLLAWFALSPGHLCSRQHSGRSRISCRNWLMARICSSPWAATSYSPTSSTSCPLDKLETDSMPAAASSSGASSAAPPSTSAVCRGIGLYPPDWIHIVALRGSNWQRSQSVYKELHWHHNLFFVPIGSHTQVKCLAVSLTHRCWPQ